jgi:hypothetical protein
VVREEQLAATPHPDLPRPQGQPKSFREPELIRRLDAAHQQLKAPIVLIWDRLSLHKTPAIRAAIAARPWQRATNYRPTRRNSTRSRRPVDDERQDSRLSSCHRTGPCRSVT